MEAAWRPCSTANRRGAAEGKARRALAPAAIRSAAEDAEASAWRESTRLLSKSLKEQKLTQNACGAGVPSQLRIRIAVCYRASLGERRNLAASAYDPLAVESARCAPAYSNKGNAS